MLLKRPLVLALALAACQDQTCDASYLTDQDAGDACAAILCGLEAGAPVCADISSDQGNCGMCGHVCDTAFCMFGTCAVKMAPDSTNAVSIAVDDASVYWTSTTTVMMMGLDGGVPVEVASNQDHPTHVVAAGTSVVWTNGDGSLMVAPLDGGAPALLASGPSRGRPAVDATQVYWVQDNDAGTTLMAVAKGGGPPVAVSSGLPSAVAVDDTAIYWTSNTTDTITRLAKGDAGVPTALVDSGGASNFLALDTSALFWLHPIVTSVSKNGGSAVAIEDVTPANPGAASNLQVLAVDGKSVFWIGTPPASGLGGDTADIMTVPVGGGAARVLQHCSGGIGPNPPPCPSDVAVDSTFLYWAQGAIYKVPKP